MNKFVKGSIAAGAATLLLLGGAGTFALWNQSATVADATVSSGTLTLSASTGTWNTAPSKWVPGDSYTYSTNLTVTATGDNLQAWLTLDKGSLSAATASAADLALAGALQTSIAITPTAGIAATTTPNKFDVAPKVGTYTVPVVLTVTFPSSISGTTAQTGSVDLTDIAFTLQQHS